MAKKKKDGSARFNDTIPSVKLGEASTRSLSRDWGKGWRAAGRGDPLPANPSIEWLAGFRDRKRMTSA